MPDELKAEISAAAEVSGRSLHAELLFRLGASLEHNRKESDLLGAQMRQQEARLETVKVKHQVIHLAHCVRHLISLIDNHDVKLSKPDRELVVIADSAAEDGLKYQTELNPELLLEEYKRTFQQAKDMLKYWAPEYNPWPGSEEEEALKPVKRTRKAKPDTAA